MTSKDDKGREDLDDLELKNTLVLLPTDSYVCLI